VKAALASVRFAAALPKEDHSTVPDGMSAATSALNVGAPVPPVAGPANTEFCAALLNAKVSAGVVVAVATLVVKSGLRAPALKLVTVPVPAGRSAATSARNVGVAAAPVVGPAHTVLAFCVVIAKVNAGVVVGVATDDVMMVPMFPALNEVTVPVGAAPLAAAVINPWALTVMLA
jgi:hypothetical protein